jgi:hypothetical protein
VLTSRHQVSDKYYSFADVDGARVPALYAALRATLPHDESDVSVNYSWLKPAEIDALWKDPKGVPLPFTFVFKRKSEKVVLTISLVFTVLRVEVIAPTEDEAARVHEFVRDTLALKSPTDEEIRGVATPANMNALLWRIHDRLDKFDSSPSVSHHAKLRCFISFRFDDHSKALALELREFLELVEVEFVSGLGFEPRSVSEKVLARLSGKLDLFVIIHSETGDSAWLNQEIGVARAREIPIVVLREGDAPYDPGLLGDTEYIQFPQGSISKAHVPLLQALRFVRESRRPGA